MSAACLSLKVSFKRSTLNVRKTRVGSFQMEDLAGKIGGVTGVEYKHNNLPGNKDMIARWS